MAYVKNPKANRGGRNSSPSKVNSAKRTGKQSKVLHASRPNPQKSRRARSESFQKRLFANSRRTILSVIALAGLVVILAVLYQSIATPENIIKGKINDLAADYYENYFYDEILTYAPTEKSLDHVMQQYADHGFAKISLRQLLLFDKRRNADVRDAITSYCNENQTTVRIYPTAPYGRTDYRIDYNYSCNF